MLNFKFGFGLKPKSEPMQEEKNILMNLNWQANIGIMLADGEKLWGQYKAILKCLRKNL